MPQKRSVSWFLLLDVTQSGRCCICKPPSAVLCSSPVNYYWVWYQNVLFRWKTTTGEMLWLLVQRMMMWKIHLLAVFFPHTPMSGHLDDHAFLLLPWRNFWHFIYSPFRHLFAALQHIYPTFFLRCEKITFQHLWHFIKQNYFLLSCVLCFFQTYREPLDPEH